MTDMDEDLPPKARIRLLETELTREREAREALAAKVEALTAVINSMKNDQSRWMGMGKMALIAGGVLAAAVALFADGTEAMRNLRGGS